MKGRSLAVVACRKCDLTVLYEDGRPVSFWPEYRDAWHVGDIYAGRVTHVVKNIEGAFVEIGPDLTGYYAVSEQTKHLYTSGRDPSLPPKEGDELLVQIGREPSGIKKMMLNGRLNLAGQLLVLSLGDTPGIHVSAKLPDEDRRTLVQSLKEWLPEAAGGFPAVWVLRTAGAQAPPEAIMAECSVLALRMESILEKRMFLRSGSRVYEADPIYVRVMARYPDLTEVVTDVPRIHERILEAAKDLSHTARIRLHEDDWPLAKVRSMATALDHALMKRVWLNSGAFLVVEQTEAMAVIDVNTGKNIRKGQKEDTFLAINLEAAAEIGRQLRLRNLSGIIMVDFIDMKSADHRRILMESLSDILKCDPVPAAVVDMTKLGIVELTRKRMYKPLHDYNREDLEFL